MRILFQIYFCLTLLSGFAQDQHLRINAYVSIEKSDGGYILISNEGKKSMEYTYIYPSVDKGYVETIIVVPSTDTIKKAPIYDRCGGDSYSRSITRHYYILDIMKDLDVIESYYIDGLSSAEDYTGYSDYGYALRKGKYALITWKGEILTEFKYRDQSLSSYEHKGAIFSVVLDKFKAQEIFKTKDSIVKYWNPQNYLLKNRNGKYHLTFHSKRYKVPKEFQFVKELPIESTLFTFSASNIERGFLTLDGSKMVNKFIPVTNFFKGYCVAYEIIDEGGDTNSRGQVMPRQVSQFPMIINEKFEIVKGLPEASRWWSDSGFNKFGQVIVESSETSSSYFVIDYTGRHIISPSKYGNRIKEWCDGLYEIQDYSYASSSESKKQNNFYNQMGEKLLNGEEQHYFSRLSFKEGDNVNYLWYDRIP